ncbi:MAG: hypothetical protein LBR17_04940 [Bacteroidales bacterium]|jgi:hypothetical protein|nr:hypothetical protein [Bacteroidales bacterium]
MKRQRIFVTHIVPKHLIEKLPVSTAGNYFSYNLISGNMFDCVFSLIPVNIRQKIKPAKSEKIKYVQNRFFSHSNIGKAFNILLENIQLIFSIKRNSNVWFYNLTAHTILAFLLLRYFRKSVKTYIIVLDYTPASAKFSLQYWILKCINRANGMIALSSAQELANPNKAIIPGVVPTKEQLYPQLTDITYNFLLSGLLKRIISPQYVLEAFSKLPDYNLYISGKAEDESMFVQYAEKYPNIHYCGFLSYPEYLSLLQKVTFCISSRDKSFPENNFNFPSKMIEYLLYNKIVISTMCYPQLSGIEYLLQTEGESLFDFLKKIETLNKEELLQQYANQSQTIIEKMGTSCWQKTMTDIEHNEQTNICITH